MTSNLHIDFETRSMLDLKVVGASVYASHPSTDILCVAFKLDDGKTQLITQKQLYDPYFMAESPFRSYVSNTDIIFKAHNASFEQMIWKYVMTRYGFVQMPIRRWRCTMAKCGHAGIPLPLDKGSEALGLELKKDKEGKAAMMKLSRPRKITEKNKEPFWTPETAPEAFEKLYAYNKTDVEVEYLIDKRLPDLHPLEQEIWFLDQEINQRGVAVDIPLCHKSTQIIEEHSKILLEEFKTLTGGEVDSPNQAKVLKEWFNDQNVCIDSVAKNVIQDIIDNNNVSFTVKRVAEIRQELSKASTAKLIQLVEGSDEDGRSRYLLQYGAAHTLRWGGRRSQPHNMPKGTLDSDTAIEAIQTGSRDWVASCYPNVFEAVSSSLRGHFIAGRGKKIYVADFASIEARGLAWAAGQENSLENFRQGKNPYCVAAENIYGYPIDKNIHKMEYPVGKVSELALGYMGGIGAYVKMSSMYRIDLIPAYEALVESFTEEELRTAEYCLEYYRKKGGAEIDDRVGIVADVIKQRWRKANDKIVEFWSTQEQAAMKAVSDYYILKKVYSNTKDGYPDVKAGKVNWRMSENGEFLHCILPSGRSIMYHWPIIKYEYNDRGLEKRTLTYMVQDSLTKQYVRKKSYGGLITENIIQASSRDILADRMLELRRQNFDIVLHVHDEIVGEDDLKNGRFNQFMQIIETPPLWAPGFPLAAEGWEGTRYRK